MLACSLALTVAFVAAEAVVRGTLFHGWFAGEWFREVPALRRLRSPLRYVHAGEDLHWELRAELGMGPAGKEPHTPDPLVGWRPGAPVTEDFQHADRKKVRDQRPVLLFGDSFAQGVIEREHRFQVLFEGTRYADAMQLINYGCGGYGFDQIYLTANRALPHWVEDRPLVLMSLLVDDDMDRMRLSFRGWPKPRFRMVDGEPVLERDACLSSAEHLGARSPWSVSWAWQALVHTEGLGELGEWLCGNQRADREVREVARVLLERNIAELEAAGVPFGYVLFQELTSYGRPQKLGWREQLVVEVLEEHGVPYRINRLRLEAHQREHRKPLSYYFQTEGLGLNHLAAGGQRLALEDMLELIELLLEQETEPWSARPRLWVTDYDGIEQAGPRASVHVPEDSSELWLRVTSAGPSTLTYRVEAGQRLELEAQLKANADLLEAGKLAPAGLELSLRLDGTELRRVTLERGGPAVDIDELLERDGELVLECVKTEEPKGTVLLRLENR